MRLKGAVLVLALALSACTASPLDEMNRIAATGDTEPFPANYRVLLQHHYGLNRPADLTITEPRLLPAANAFDPARWYVCVETSAGAETIHVISRARLEGTIKIPATPANAEPQPNLCDGGIYGPLG
jgi:hypothetical protein